MSSKRHRRYKACSRKIRHADRANASKHARRLGPPHGIYRCRFCGGWHVGKPNRAQRQAMRARLFNE